MNSQLSIVLIDDNRTPRDGIISLIREQPGFMVLAVSADVERAIREISATLPDLVLLNLVREGDHTLTFAGALHGEAPASRVVVMGLQPGEDDVASLVRAGVSGFLMADASLETLLATLYAVAGGTRVLPKELTASLFSQIKQHSDLRRPGRVLDVNRLTKRERAVTDLIIQGCSNKEIADRLEIALHTVKSHVHKVLAKLSVNSRLEVAAFSRNRLAPVPPPAHSIDGAS